MIGPGCDRGHRRHDAFLVAGLGADNHEVLSSVGGLDDAEIAALEADGVIADTLGDIAYG